MRITVLGKSPSWQDAGGACSGYLIEEDGFSLLLDCGNGVFSKLRGQLDYVDFDAVLISHLHAAEDLIESAFDLAEYDGPDSLSLGPFTIRFCEVPHYTRPFAVEIADDGGRLTYSADCSPNEQLVDFARATDLLLIEATLSRPERTGSRGHLTPAEAGEHGRRAGARRVVLTHFSDELDPDLARAEASEACGAPVELAHEGAVYELPAS